LLASNKCFDIKGSFLAEDVFWQHRFGYLC